MESDIYHQLDVCNDRALIQSFFFTRIYSTIEKGFGKIKKKNLVSIDITDVSIIIIIGIQYFNFNLYAFIDHTCKYLIVV